MEKKTRLRPTPTALLNPRCDASFKAMFTQETKESHAALQDFISTLLGRQVKEVQLVPNEPPVDMIGEMQMSFDVSIIFDDDERADLEMQARQQEYDYAVRAETQAARLLNLSARKGKNWKVAKVYQISVLDFHFDKDDKSALEWYTMRKASGGKLGERLNVIFFDLLKIKKLLGTPPEKLTKLEKWGLFLSYAEDETKKDYLESLILSEEGIMNAKTALSKVSQDDINWAIENSIFKARMDYNTGLYNAEQRGLRQGLEQGEHKAQIETAKRMLEAKICSLEQIADMTSLSIEEVKGLQKQG